jgi:secondary thiamine-phosphate synthase enzyme
MVVLDFSIVNVALAAIERELHADATSVQWVITAYAITFGGLLVLGGRMGDLWGRRRMFIVGLVVFSLASLVGGLAGNLATLVVARAVQGIGAAIVAPAALSLVATSAPEGQARTKALGYYGATASIGYVAGLVLGGALVQYFDWRAVLWVNVPIGIGAAILTPILVAKPVPSDQRRRLDVVGALLLTGSVGAAVYGISVAPAAGWTSGPTSAAPLIVLAIVLGVAFVTVERRHATPLVRLSILRLRSLRAANLYMLAIGAWSAGELLVIALFFQQGLHYSPLLTCLAIAPQGVAGFLGATQGARVVRRIGLRSYLVVSAFVAAVGLLLLGLDLGLHNYPLLLTAFMLAGYGASTAAFGATVAATQGVANSEQGLVGGLVNMSRQVGAALGAAVVAAVIGTSATSGVSGARDRAALFATAAAAFLAILVIVHGITKRFPAASPGLPTADRSSTRVSMRARQMHRIPLVDAPLGITALVTEAICESHVTVGLAIAFTPHTTVAITLVAGPDAAEFDDQVDEIRCLVPPRKDFRSPYDTPQDAAGHVKSALIGNALTIIIAEGKPVLGRAQRICLLEFDSPRRRRIHVQVKGS